MVSMVFFFIVHSNLMYCFQRTQAVCIFLTLQLHHQQIQTFFFSFHIFSLIVFPFQYRPLFKRVLDLTNHHTGFNLQPPGQEDFFIIQYNAGDQYQ